MRKKDLNFEIVSNTRLNGSTSLLKVRPLGAESLPEIYPGQFVNIQVDEQGVFLRRPISICNFDPYNNELWLMIKKAGKGSEALTRTLPGETLRILLPLGNGFSLPAPDRRVLLIGGGVGVAPLFFLGRWLKSLDFKTTFLIGARCKDDLTFVDELSELGTLYITTDDGSYGERGVVTDHSCLEGEWDNFYVCGPQIMMKAVARLAREKDIDCEVSLENSMACGLGACLCCVEDTVDGNQCVCTEGPVFNIKSLKW